MVPIRAATIALVLAGLIFLPLSATHLNAQPATAQAPILKAGDSWVWQWENDFQGKHTTGTTKRAVVRKDVFEGRDVYIWSRDDGLFSVVSMDLTAIARLDAAGSVKTRFKTKGDSQFPLTVGRAYTQEIDNPIDQYYGTYTYTITGTEEVRTRPGAFMAFRVAEEGKARLYRSKSFTVKGTRYYAPAAKAFVKSSYETSLGRKYSEELASYQVLP